MDGPERRKDTKARKRAVQRTLGWREWVELPDFGIRTIKAKLDTGARTSSLHAVRPRRFLRDGLEMVRFEIHPVQRSRASTVQVEARVTGERAVRTSGGEQEIRLVIETTVGVGGVRWPIELTLTRRDQMGFRMLLGRQALNGRIVVDPASSYLASGRGLGDAKKKLPNSREEEE